MADLLDTSVPAVNGSLQQARTTMRPAVAAADRMERQEFRGRDEVAAFFGTVPAGGRLDQIRLVATHANGQPALAAYLPDDRGTCRGYGIMVLTVTDGLVAEIIGFPRPRPALLPRPRVPCWDGGGPGSAAAGG